MTLFVVVINLIWGCWMCLFFNAWCGMKMSRGVLDSQMLQPGQVSEGPLLNDPQAVNIPHRTAGVRQSEGGNQQ